MPEGGGASRGLGDLPGKGRRAYLEPGMVKLKRLKIGKYRNVKPGTELRFSDGFNILLGQNATGKTTLLELITAVVRGDVEALSREELELEFDLAVSAGTIQVKLANRQAEPSVRAEIPGVALNERRMALTYDISLHLHDVDARFVGDEKTATLMRPSKATVDVAMFGPEFGLVASLLLAADEAIAMPVETFGELVSVRNDLRRFDESLLRFDDQLAMIIRSFGPEGSSHVVGPYTPHEVRTRIGDRSVEQKARGFQIPASELAFLSEAVSRFDLASAELRLELLRQMPATETYEERFTFGKPSFYFVDHDGSGFTQDRLSYGQKRLLSFLYYLACNPDICVADELVNGLHHEWIAACVEDLGKRQTFLASQNPLLLDHLQFSSAEEARQSFICCTRERTDKKTTLHWENMSEDDASAFYRAYDAGLQHVGDILRTHGLW